MASASAVPNNGSTTSRIKWDGAINFGTVIHIAVLVVAVVLGWGAFDKRLAMIEHDHKELGKQLQIIDARSERMERYMLAHDPRYYDVMPQQEKYGMKDESK
jgi:hypothetical protein